MLYFIGKKIFMISTSFCIIFFCIASSFVMVIQIYLQVVGTWIINENLINFKFGCHKRVLPAKTWLPSPSINFLIPFSIDLMKKSFCHQS